jgi:hypothetical protein
VTFLCFTHLGRGEEVGSVLLKLTGVEQRFNAVVKLRRNGLTVTEVTERYGVSRQAVHGGLPGPAEAWRAQRALEDHGVPRP